MKLNTILMGVVSAATIALGVHTASAQVKLNMANEYADSSFQADGDKFFIERVKELTKGNVDLDYFPGGGLGYKSADHFDAVSDGAIDIANTFIGRLSGIDPIFLLPSQPFVVTTEKEAQVLEGVLAPYYEKIFGDAGQVYLFSSPWPPSGLWSRTQIMEGADLKDLKIRVSDANATIIFQEVGAAPLQLSWADVLAQLSTNALDAVLTSAEGGVNSKFWEYMPYYEALNYTTPVNVVHMNADAFNALSDEDQAAIRQAASETVDKQWGALAERLEANYKVMKENKVNVIQDVPAPILDILRKASDVSMKSWLEKTGDTGATIVEAYKAELN